MSKTMKFVIGFFTFLPLFLFLWFLSYMYSTFGELQSLKVDESSNPDEVLSLLAGMVAPFFSMIIISFALLIFYLVDVFSLNPKFKNDTESNKLIWTLILLFTGIAGMIAYFFIYIKPRSEKDFAEAAAIKEEFGGYEN